MSKYNGMRLFIGYIALTSSWCFAESSLLNQQNNDWFLLGTNETTGMSVFADRANIKISKIKKNDMVDVLVKLTRPCTDGEKGNKCYAVLDYSFNCTKKEAKIVRGQLFNIKTDKLQEDYGFFEGGFKNITENDGTPVSLVMVGVCSNNSK